VTRWPEGYALKHFQELDSTNDEARRLAGVGERGPLWISADRQTKGRGRRGKTWETLRGNLAASLLLSPTKAARECAQLSFVAALAVSDLIDGCHPDTEVCVKWPNDVLAGERKIAGILLESAAGGSDRLDWLAVGIGINLAEYPTDTEFPATSLVELGCPDLSPPEALTRLAGFWAEWYAKWEAHGFADIRETWLSRAARLGTRICARLPAGEAVGIFEGIDENGALLLRESMRRTRRIAAGEVFFG
jgi:BirA family transcriptional regulator, biotin operon repressor / biotin---[acetyl-CoA-carboxylase] ligase